MEECCIVQLLFLDPSADVIVKISMRENVHGFVQAGKVSEVSENYAVLKFVTRKNDTDNFQLSN